MSTLSDLRDICYYHGWHDKSTEGISALDRFINRTIQMLANLAPWEEYQKRDGKVQLLNIAIDSFSDYSGTVSGTVKATTSSAHGFSDNDKVYIYGSDNYGGDYTITTIDDTSFYFTATWSSDDSSGAYCGSNYYTLKDSDGNDITDIAHAGQFCKDDEYTSMHKIPGGIEEWILRTRTSKFSSTRTEYTLRKFVSSGNVKMEILLDPLPSDRDIIYFAYRIYPTTLSSSTDVTDWPDYRLWLLEQALEIRLASRDRDRGGARLEGADFMAQVERAMANSRTSYMPIQVDYDRNHRGRDVREVPFRINS